MATILDLSILQTFDVIFPVLLVFSVVFAIFAKTKAVSNSPVINAVIAIAVSFMVLLSEIAIDLINVMIPWFTVAILFFILLLLVFMIFGATEKDIFSYMKTDKGVGWALIGVVLVIAVAAFGQVLGQSIGPYLDEEGGVAENSRDVATSDFETNIMATLFHPKVLGLIVLFGIMIFAVGLLTGDATHP
jgi:membrane protease YdiL (CAAX protease family)